MSANDPFDAVRIVGVHTTEQSRDLSHRSGFSLALEAVHGALADAGMDVSDVDGIASWVTEGWPYGVDEPVLYQPTFWARQLRRPLRWVPVAWGIPAMLDAAGAIANGLASTVVLVVGGSRARPADATASWTRPPDEFTAWTGSYTAVQFALAAQRYIHEYGPTGLEGMAEAAAAIRTFGHLNPDAVYAGRGPFSAEDVLRSRPVASPLTLLMCSTVSDGGCAIVMTHRDRARDTRRTPIRILGGGNQQPYPAYFEPPVLHYVPDEGAFAREGLARAGIRHDDIDVVEFYDHFASGVLMQYETYGFCGQGEAGEFVKSGVMRLDGRYPTCTDGGNLSFSHNGNPTLFRPIEAVRQLRGDVRDGCPGWDRGEHTHDPSLCRAVRDPQVAFVTNAGPPTGGGSFMVLAR